VRGKEKEEIRSENKQRGEGGRGTGEAGLGEKRCKGGKEGGVGLGRLGKKPPVHKHKTPRKRVTRTEIRWQGAGRDEGRLWGKFLFCIIMDSDPAKILTEKKRKKNRESSVRQI